MPRRLSIETERFPLAETFTIARGSKTEAEVVVCAIHDGPGSGRGECVPYRRYDETIDSVREAIEAIRPHIVAGITRDDLQARMKPGAARNAVDCALWDLEAKLSGVPAHSSVCSALPQPLITAYTLSLGNAEVMAAKAKANAFRPLLKIKVGGGDDAARIRAVAEAAPKSRIIVDANEGWTARTIRGNLLAAAECRVALVEQPLPAGEDGLLRDIPHPVPICADESLHTAADLDGLLGLYDAVNIKLDKTGGLTAALELKEKARNMGFGVMVGCMVGTSLAMAPAVLLGQEADFIDLDGPLLLEKDRSPGLSYADSVVSPPSSKLWG